MKERETETETETERQRNIFKGGGGGGSEEGFPVLLKEPAHELMCILNAHFSSGVAVAGYCARKDKLVRLR